MITGGLKFLSAVKEPFEEEVYGEVLTSKGGLKTSAFGKLFSKHVATGLTDREFRRLSCGVIQSACVRWENKRKQKELQGLNL